MDLSCYHCGQPAANEALIFDDLQFCCDGCKTVYEILNSNSLSNYYIFNKKAGIRPETRRSEYDYLDAEDVQEKLIDFSEGNTTLITLSIPIMHCSSCIWLLESLHTIKSSIKYSQVNFTRKTLQVAFDNSQLKLSELAIFLSSLGYRPAINLESSEKKRETLDKTLLIKFAIAGFTFGNGMFLSLPEYFGEGDLWVEENKNLLRGILFVFGTVVAFYCASDYYRSAWFGLKNKFINIEVPIVIGIMVLYGRSVYEVLTDYGPGYFDTLCGLLFWMLLGKLFQKRTYNALSYDRDYKSFYPISVTKLAEDGKQQTILLSDISIGDHILVRNQEIVPVDSMLVSAEANIDNSFITGESMLVKKMSGEKIFAGGRQVGASVEMKVTRTVNQSYLTQLWNMDAFKKNDTGLDTFTNGISRQFTIVILTIALIAGSYWYFVDIEKMFQVIAAVLIVACPCALALSAPFTFGHVMRILSRNKFYAKDSSTIEKLAKIDTIVFDKTGTITQKKKTDVGFEGEELEESDLLNLKTLVNSSNHPLSRILYENLPVSDPYYPVKGFEEIAGQGYEGTVQGHCYRIGSASFNGQRKSSFETAVFVSKDSSYLGKFKFKNKYRAGLRKTFKSLEKYKLYLLSGDNDSEKEVLQKLYPEFSEMVFNQSPKDKLMYIKNLQGHHRKIAMVGDGLNDAGALRQADAGIAVSDDGNGFTPASDVIMDGSKMTELQNFLMVCRQSINIVKLMFVISFIYNIVGLGYAVTGNMSPLFAAVIMPLSSITVVLMTTFFGWAMERKYFKAEH
ncbi:heavy metal translocating P-type ATPase [Chryseobacterium hispalense]|uniref:heavy metal translocating P-type ATPase n=1 Tax=Chryseobacterium hispalense TaxID=1453492 RepID=UPI000493A909|nr:heavy metal translocating P-type ATPase metal-binding domain-containing protein [Chryseobacterium hispalense]